MFPAENVELLSWLSLDDLFPNLSNANDCWGYVSPSGREYAIIGHNRGATFVEVTDPRNPGTPNTITGPQSSAHDIKVYLDHAYVVSGGGGGIQVIDMSQIDSGVVTLSGTSGNGGTHNVAVDTDSGYLSSDLRSRRIDSLPRLATTK